jgi:hypothetical protein
MSTKPKLKDVVNKTWYNDGEGRKCIVPVTGSGAHLQPWGSGDNFRWEHISFQDGLTGLEIVNAEGEVICTKGKWHPRKPAVVMTVGSSTRAIMYEPLPANIPPEARVCSMQNVIADDDPFKQLPWAQ